MDEKVPAKKMGASLNERARNQQSLATAKAGSSL
jgi:hypothetical protein